MMHWRLCSKIRFSRTFFWFLAVLLMYIPVRWLLAAFVSAYIHELFHIAAIRLCGKEIFDIEIGVLGAQIYMEPMGGWREFMCLAAGPVGSLLLGYFFRWVPAIAFLGCIQGVFNLLPILPLDGGRMLACILHGCVDRKMEQILMILAEILVYLLFTFLFVVFSFVMKMGIWPSFVILILMIHKIAGKIPCKLSQLGVQ